MTVSIRFVLAAAMLAAPPVLAQSAGPASPASAGEQAQSQAASQKPLSAEMAAVLEKARKFTEPGASHKTLQRFLGDWTTETSLFMNGKAQPGEKGVAQFSWLMPGRWMKSEGSGVLFGRPHRNFMVIGYDNFKQSFVSVSMTDLDTAMAYSEGDMDPGGKSLIMYGTLDEYLSGEHDKMVRYVWRFPSNDRLTLEVHDLPIGEANTKVLEVTFIRK